jgi:hypothetical protein
MHKCISYQNSIIHTNDDKIELGMRIDIRHDSSYSRYWTIVFFVTGGISPLRVIIPKAVAFIATTAPLFSRMQSTSSSSSLSLSMLSSSLLEIEQKFSFTNRSDIEDRLRRVNFVLVKEVTMVDWYFDRFNDNDDDDDDDDYNSLDLPLVQQDHWLRYREILSSQDNKNNNDSDNDCDGTGKWQLKRGTNARTTNSNNDSSGCSTTTVYEEVEGLDAVRIAHSILEQSPLSQPQKATSSTNFNTLLFDECIIPVLPIPDIKNLEPFARIETRRSTWKQKIMQQNDNNNSTTNGDGAFSSYSLFPNLTVDLDCTPDGYNLGEVEAVVDCKNINAAATAAAIMSEEEVTEVSKNNDRTAAQAKEDIQQLLSILFKNDDQQQQQRPPMGKLENFLFCNRPRMYRMCIESGVIPQQQIVLGTNQPEHTDDEMK